MPKLTPEELQSRLKFDYQVVMRMQSEVMQVFAFRNPDDMASRRNPILSEEQGHLATHYLVDYYIRTLIGPDEYSDKTTVKFDLLANRNYPFTVPGIFVVESESPHPWTPHFRSGLPVCIDHDVWVEGQGTVLLGILFVHVAKLLNFDEIPRSETYGGYTPEAADYWRKKLNRQPLNLAFNRELKYPVLPQEVVNRIIKPPGGMFQAIVSEPPGTELFARSARHLFSPGSNPAVVEVAENAQSSLDNSLPLPVDTVPSAPASNRLFAPKSSQTSLPPAEPISREPAGTAEPLFKPRPGN